MMSWPLPNELSLQVISYCSHRDTRNLYQTCHSLYALCRANGLYDIIRVGLSQDEAFKFPTPNEDGRNALHKPDRFVWDTRASLARALYQDVLQLEQYAISPLLHEAFVGMGHYDADIDAFRQLLHVAHKLKSLHIFGIASPHAPLAISTAMTAVRNSPRVRLDHLDFNWRWEGNHPAILDAAAEGPKGLKRLKLNLKHNATSRTPIPQYMLSRIIKRMAANSMSTITELDVCYHQRLPGGSIRPTEIDLCEFAQMPLKILRYQTSPENIDLLYNPEKNNLNKICKSFPLLEELFLGEMRPVLVWTKANIEYLSKLERCKKLTLSYCFPFNTEEFWNWDQYDYFVSMLPREGTSEFSARQLINRIEATQRVAEVISSLEKLAWIDTTLESLDIREPSWQHVGEILRSTNPRGDTSMEQEEDEAKKTSEQITSIKWQWQPWWDAVKETELGPDIPGRERDLAALWKCIYEDGSRSRSFSS